MDYPHSDSVWPDVPEQLEEVFTGVSDEDINKITHENAMAWYNYNPFAGTDKADTTVGALRASVSDHDIEIKALGTGRYAERSVSLADMAAASSAKS